ncbi:hypothetical protein GGR50DRAFT_660596 [Xylaria sp. CBS 124048]|nr:hypothetical protein GGR50DRAFT_660596 [Xylaria sp. CBS 124048]
MDGSKDGDEEIRGDITRAEAALKELEEQIGPLTLDEYIETYHELVYTKLRVKPVTQMKMSKSIPPPGADFFPRRLMPWKDYHEKQSEILSTVYQHFPVEKRLFSNRFFLQELGKGAMETPIANKGMLTFSLDQDIECPVTRIINELSKSDEFRSEFHLGLDIEFQYDWGFSHEIENSQPQGRPDTVLDRVCVYRYEEEATVKRAAIAVLAHKPPQELSLAHLRAGLRETDMMDAVANNEIPTDEKAKFQHYATKVVVSAVTQTFQQMVDFGLAYGLLTTGDAMVFLKIDWDDPQTVYYHFAEPVRDVAAAHNDYRSFSAVTQYLAFHLLALSDYTYRGKAIRDQAISGLLASSAECRKATTEALEDHQRLSWSPFALVPTERNTGRQKARLTAKHSEGEANRDAGDRGKTKWCRGPGCDRKQYEGKPHRDLAYCTQECLLGLLEGDALDPDCPNLRLHQRNDESSAADTDHSSHPIDQHEFLQLLSHQLVHTLDYGITSLRRQGHCGALSKVTLLKYGYTFISKGTTDKLVPRLEHEARVYQRLEDVQGVHVPVFLGAIDLRPLKTTYYYDVDVDVVYMCFMSWGGVALNQIGPDLDKSTLSTMSVEAMRVIHQRGVVHDDASYGNILFNEQTGGVMLIDYDRSLLLCVKDHNNDDDDDDEEKGPTIAVLESGMVPDSEEQVKSVSYDDVIELPPRVRSLLLADLAGVDATFYAGTW